MPLALQAFTTPSNTNVVADTAAPPASLPTPAVFTTPSTPLINGNGNYIWSPNTASGQTVTFNTLFNLPGLPIINLGLPVSVFYAFAGNETVTVSASLEVVNVLGIVILTVPLFVGANGSNPENVVTLSADTLLALAVLDTVRINVTTTVVAPVTLPYDPANTGRYLGEVIVRTII
ncbi:hypothetical protein [Psychrobacillus sp.]|uniref:hypothetical protein n=1 Tax=Psychrobacillus sp. TaxID=1871623 RepID=UPI0028BF1BAE|nr:hypothetical protein [Psychrobacillus sp.]